MILNDAGQGKEQEIKQKLQSGDLGMWNNIWKLGKLTEKTDGSFFSSFSQKNPEARQRAMSKLK